MSTTPSTPRAERLLLVSAGALGALAAWAWLAGPVSAIPGSPALAEMAVTGSDHALITSDTGGNADDVLLVLDQRSEELLVYRPLNGRAIDFRGKLSLRALFAEARAGAGIVPLAEPARPAETPPASTPDNAPNPPR